MLMSDSLEALGQVADSLTTYLQGKGWAINPQKMQGPGLSVKFLGVVWSGKTKVLSRAVIDKVQVFPVPTTPKQLREFLGILGYWRSFITHLVQLLRPFDRLIKRGNCGTGGEQNKRLFNRQNWLLSKPRRWVYLILPSQLNWMSVSLSTALTGVCGNARIPFGPR